MSALPTAHEFAGILPNREALEQMGRKAYQDCKLQKTSGRKPRWFVRYTVPELTGPNEYQRVGKREYLGFVDEIGIREASKLRDELRRKVNSVQAVVQSQVKFDNLLKAYEQVEVPAKSPNSQPTYISTINVHIRPTFGNLRLCDIDQMQVQKWLNGLAATLTKASVKRVRSILMGIFECAADWGYSQQRNPVKRTKLPPCQQSQTDLRALTPDELRRLFAVTAGMRDNLGQIVQVAAFTGLRIGEILGLHWSDYRPPVLEVKRSRSQWNGIEKAPKSESGRRTVPLGPVALDRPPDARDADRIFPVEYNYVRRDLRRAFEAAGITISGTACHALRRSFATYFDAAGGRYLKEQLGHAHESMSRHYVRRTFADDQYAVNRMAEFIFGLGSGIKQ